MAQPNYRPDIEPDIKPNLRVVSDNDRPDQTATQLSSAESRPNLQVIDGGGESTPERGNLKAVDDIDNAEKAGNPLTATPFQNNTSPKSGASLPNGFNAKALSFFKKRSATIGIVATIAGAATFPFLGTLSLPFALFGNLNLQSVLQGATQYMEDYTAFRVFGNKTSVAFKDDKMAGLTGPQIDELEENGIKLNGPTKTATGKTVFESIEIGDNPPIKNADEFKAAMRAHPELRSKVIISKPSLWKSAKSAVAKGIITKERVNTNPTIEDGSPQEEKKQILKDVVVDTTGEPSVSTGSDDGLDNDEQAQRAKVADTANAVGNDLTADINAAKAAVSEGLQTANNVEMDNIPKLLSTESKTGNNLVKITKSVWGAINPLGMTDDLCTAYQVADTANTIARVFVATNLVRLALTFRASVEKVMAGDGDPATLNAYMETLNTPNPSTGESFDQSAAAQMVFNNVVSGDPMTLTALGGAGMMMLYAGMRSINSFFGTVRPGQGKNIIKSTCNIAQNLGVQATVLAGSVALGIISGGTTAVAEGAAMTTGRTAVNLGIKTMAKSLVEDVVKQVAEKGALVAVKDLTKSALKTATKKSWTSLKSLVKSPGDLMSLALVGTQTFAMGYIVDALTGGNIANALYSGTSFISGVITGSNVYDYRNAIASGAVVSDISTATAYMNNEYRSYQQSYVAYMQDQARSAPFDYTNQYSAVGSAVASFRKTFGTGAFSSISSAITSLASLPSNVGKLFFTSAYADATPDLTAVNEAVANPFYTENNIAVQITGTPLAVFNKTYSFAEIKEQLIDSANPQITYNGDDSETGEPNLSITTGSNLEKYRNKCHNPDNTELDDMFQEDPVSVSNFDISCTAGHKGGVKITNDITISAEEASLYDDAISYITQITPSEDTTSSVNEDATSSSETSVTSEEWKSYSNGKIPLSALAKLSSVGLTGCSGSISVPYLAPSALSALKRMYDAYKSDTGKTFELDSCYRTYEQQETAWSLYKAGKGNLAAEPGTSNHGLSKAVDISMKSDGGYNSPQYKWLKKHATEYGWVTGRVGGEPWHIEYTGSLP